MGSFLNSTGQTVKLASGHRLQTTDITNMYQPGRKAFLDSLNQGSAGNGFTIEVLKNHLTLINAEGQRSAQLQAAMPEMPYPLSTNGRRLDLVTCLLTVLAAETSVEEADRALEEEAEEEAAREAQEGADASGGGSESYGDGASAEATVGEGDEEREQDGARTAPAPVKRRRVTGAPAAAAANPPVQMDEYKKKYTQRVPRRGST